MFETMKGTSKVNSVNRIMIFSVWLSNENRRAWRTDFSTVSSVKNADAFWSIFSIKTNVNTEGILIIKIINNTANKIKDKRDKNIWLWNI